MGVEQAAPDIDVRLSYPGFGHTGQGGICRLRVWSDRQVAMVTEDDDNPGPSITNCIEHVANAAEALLHVQLGREDGAVYAGGYVLLEHYQRPDVDTLDRVVFASRDFAGRPMAPTWGPANGHRWVLDAVAS